MTRLQYQIVGCVALVLAGVIGWSWIARAHAETNQRAAEDRTAKIEGQVAELVRQASDLAAVRDDLTENNKTLQKTAEEWKKKANGWRPPPPPPPPPDSDPDLAESLVKLGFLDGLKVTPEGPGTMPRNDASLAYQWQGLAAQIPSYQAQVETQDKAIQTCSLALDGVKIELTTCDKQRGLVQREADLQREKAAEQKLATDAVKKQLKAEGLKKWYWTAGAVILTYLVRK